MIELTQLHARDLIFPAPATALTEPNGLLAFGGDLRPERLLAAYKLGIFPWYNDDQPILWWSPNPRAVLFPHAVHISRSLQKTLRKGALTVTFDTQFDSVMQECAAATGKRPATWITSAIRQGYGELHRQGYAQSVEVWVQGRLVGGMYGIALGGVFFGESMFSRERDASKVALVHLCGQLQQWGFSVIDCQVSSNHLRSMGAVEIDRAEFGRLLLQHTIRSNPGNSSPWQLTWSWIEHGR